MTDSAAPRRKPGHVRSVTDLSATAAPADATWRRFEDFLVEFVNEVAYELEHRPPGGSEMIVAARLQPIAVDSAAKPPIPFHPLEQWIQRARADVVAVMPQLGQDPLADDRLLSGVVKDVYFP